MSGWGPKPSSITSSGGGGVPNVPGNTPAPDPAYTIFNEVLAVPKDVVTDVITWIVPVTLNHIMRVEFGGCNIADYKLFFGANVQARYLTYFGSSLNGVWDFSTEAGGGVQVASGTVVKVRVEHGRPHDGDFWSRIQYLEIN